LDSKAVDMAAVRAESGLIQGNSITWNAASVSKLERLNPGESGTFQFALQLKNPAVKDNSENLTVVAKPRIKSNENPSFLNGNELSLKIASPSSLVPSLTSFSGPIPPSVGNTTVYKISIGIKNASNDYKDASLIGYIPLGITMDKNSINSSETAAVKFDAATGKLIWNVGQLSAHSGTAAPLRTLTFNVRATPTGTQVGQALLLMKTITFGAKDTFTNQSISLSTQDISSENIPGEGNGRVVAQ
jgi:hypothetical protein